jgi:hypothetical protein
MHHMTVDVNFVEFITLWHSLQLVNLHLGIFVGSLFRTTGQLFWKI